MAPRTFTTVSEKNKNPDVLRQHGEQVGTIIIGGNFQGLGLLRSLARRNIPIYLLDKGLCIGRFSKYCKQYYKCPNVRETSLFLGFLTNLAKEKNLEGCLIYPNDDETVYFLAKHKEQLENYYRVTTPSWETVKFAYDKTLTYKLAKRCGIAIPKTYYPINAKELEQMDIEFPVIIKPSIRQPFLRNLRKKAIRVNNMRMLVDMYDLAFKAVDKGQVPMIQELIPGGAQNLFSVGSLCRNGDLLARVVVQRPRQQPMDFGHSSTFVQTVDKPGLEESAKKILGAMGYYGLSEVEFMFDPRDGKYKLLEINARAWGWHTIAIGAGVDLPYLSYLDALGENVRQDGFTKGVKWLHLLADIPTAMVEILKGRMKISSYFGSLSGKKQEAVFSIKDPLPFIMELIILPYLWKNRGLT